MSKWKKKILCIAPPYSVAGPPAGIAALLGFLKANNCHDFDFVDFRLWSSHPPLPTYSTIGIFGETYVVDVPDLPLVLAILRAYREGAPLTHFLDEKFDSYCIPRGIDSRQLKAYVLGVDQFFEAASRQIENSDIIGFSTWSSNFLTTLIAAAHFKRRNPKVFIIAGGPQVSESSNSAKLGLQSGLFDAVVVGEGEGPLLAIHQSFTENGGQVSKNIAGVMQYLPETKEFIFPANQQMKLSELPLPSFSEMPVQAYQSDAEKVALPYQLSRGCTDRCSFCSEWVFWKSYRSIDPTVAIEHILKLQQEYSLSRITFTDSLLNGHPGRLKRFAELVIEKKIAITWSGFMRANMDPEFAQLLKQSGCSNVFVGIESMSDETLSAMNKRRVQSDNISALHAFLSAGIHVTAGLIPGFPSDNRERFIKTVQTLRQIQNQYPGSMRINIEPFSVSPAQTIYKDLSQFNLEPQHWPEEILEIAPEYRNITDNIFCTVTGENQGLERSGQYQVARLFSAKQKKTNYDGYRNKYSKSGISFEWIDESWVVLSAMSRLTTPYRLIMSREEWKKYNILIGRLYPDHQTLTDPACLENSELAKFFSTIEKRHIHCQRPSVLALLSFGSFLNFSDSSELQLTPFGVIRELKDLKKLVFITGYRSIFLSCEFGVPKILQYFKKKRKVSGFKRANKGIDQIDSKIEELLKLGLLVSCN